MRIGEVARRSGVSVRALRYYEEQGLLEADRSYSGQRIYAEGAVSRVLLVQQLYAAGMNSKAVADLLPCVHTGVATPQTLSRLAVERDRIGCRIDELVATRDRLDSIIQTARDLSAGLACDT